MDFIYLCGYTAVRENRLKCFFLSDMKKEKETWNVTPFHELSSVVIYIVSYDMTSFLVSHLLPAR